VEYDTWKHRRLDELEPVYVWADGIYVKAGLEQDKAAMLVLIAALRDGRKVVLAVESGYRDVSGRPIVSHRGRASWATRVAHPE
jgi:transposase-like protein